MGHIVNTLCFGIHTVLYHILLFFKHLFKMYKQFLAKGIGKTRSGLGWICSTDFFQAADIGHTYSKCWFPFWFQRLRIVIKCLEWDISLQWSRDVFLHSRLFTLGTQDFLLFEFTTRVRVSMTDWSLASLWCTMCIIIQAYTSITSKNKNLKKITTSLKLDYTLRKRDFRLY